jgi:GNAT superfamily N-acetyltransferase
MPADANFGFMARQLALSDFPEAPAEEFAGGLLLRSNGCWIASWDFASIEDADQLVETAISGAGDAGIRRWLLISPSTAAEAPQTTAQAESLYLGGMQQAGFEQAGLPDNIQILVKPHFSAAPKDLQIRDATPGDQELFSLLNQGDAVPEHLGVLFSGLSESPVDTFRYAVAIRQASPAGVIAWRVCGALSRVGWIWVAPEQRKSGIGAALTAYAVEQSGEAGALAVCAWTGLKGSLRYFFSKLGFEDRLRVATFLPE